LIDIVDLRYHPIMLSVDFPETNDSNFRFYVTKL